MGNYTRKGLRCFSGTIRVISSKFENFSIKNDSYGFRLGVSVRTRSSIESLSIKFFNS